MKVAEDDPRKSCSEMHNANVKPDAFHEHRLPGRPVLLLRIEPRVKARQTLAALVAMSISEL